MDHAPATQLLLACPGPDAWLRRVSGMLVTGTCVAVHLPQWINRADVRSRLYRDLVELRMVHDLDLSLEPEHKSPADFLAERFGAGDDFAKALELCRPGMVPDLPFDVLLVDGIGALGARRGGPWLDFFGKWRATLAARGPDERWPSFALFTDVVSAAWDIPARDTGMEHAFWGETCSILELRLAFRRAARLAAASPEAEFFEHVLLSLCGGDLQTALEVKETVGRSTAGELAGNVEQHLLSLANAAGISASEAEMPEVRDARERTRLDRPEIRGLLARSLVCVTPEHGAETGPLALGLASGRQWEISHRIWRGQIACVFPHLDSIRLEFNRRFAKHFGGVWPGNWKHLGSQSLEELGSYSAEFLLIVRCLEQEREFRRFRDGLDLARHAHSMRNRLAHHKLVSFDDFRRLRELRNALRD